MKRTGALPRYTPLRPSPNPKLRARTHSPEKRAWARLRREVYARDDGRCVVCGVWLIVGNWQCHHRRLRSQRGRNELANLIALCNSDHDRVHSERLASEHAGWIVPSFADPAEVPVLYADGQRRLLSNEANKEAA